jgi:tRNA (guanine37-N1)-methyltransferase
MITFHVITIFPETFDSYLKESIIGRAIKNKKVKVKFYNPRKYLPNKKNNYKPVDDKPYGGGPGMVMRAEPILKAVEKVLLKISKVSSGPRISGAPTPARPAQKLSNLKKKILIVNFIPSAEKFTTKLAKNYAKKYTDIILITGRYEGIDARVDKILKTKKISIGDYVVTGGELPAMILIDSISRQVDGVLGKNESREEERISCSEVYTRPEILKYPFKKIQGKKSKNYKVPKVLLSGNHKEIEEWKKSKK